MASREEKIAELRRLDKIAQLRAMDAAPAEVKREKPKDKWHQDFGQGVAESGISTYLGIKDLMGKASESEKSSLADLRSDASESGWGTAGRVAGELAQLMVPGSIGLKVARGLGAASKLAKVLPLATDVAASAAHGAVRLPQEGESRAANAASSGAGAVGGAVLGKALGVMGKGLKLKPEAERLRDLGVQVTPGQSVPVLRRVEDLMQVFPVTAKAVNKSRDLATETAHIAALRQAVPPGFNVSQAGALGVKQLKDAYDAAYTTAWGSVDNLAPDAVPKALTVSVEGIRGLGKKDSAAIRRVQDDIIKLLDGDPNVSGKKLDEIIRKAKGNTKKSMRLDEVLTAMRKTLRSGLPEESQKALSAIDAQYPKYLMVKEAAKTKGALKAKGHFSPDNLVAGLKSIGGDRAATGEAPMQGFVDDVMATVGQRPGMVPLTGWRRSADIMPTIGPQKTAAKILTGQGTTQQMLRKALQSRAAKNAAQRVRPVFLKSAVSAARLGAAYEDDEENQ